MTITNLTYLRELTGNDEIAVQDMVDIFMLQVPDFIQKLRSHLENRRYKELGLEAHKAKSSLLILGMNDLVEEVKIFSHKCMEGTDIESYKTHVESFEKQCTQAMEELRGKY